MTEVFDLVSTLDEDKYPTDETERRVRFFKGDVRVLMAAIKEVWAYADGYWTEKDEPDDFFPDKIVHNYYVSTAGWSGNETIIGALENNLMFWMCFWRESRRGGHYIFEVGENSKVLQVPNYKTADEQIAELKSEIADLRGQFTQKA
jgi:hypothetical protein